MTNKPGANNNTFILIETPKLETNKNIFENFEIRGLGLVAQTGY